MRVMELLSSGLDYARLRSAGKDVLSLALIDARNRTLALGAVLEARPARTWLRRAAPMPAPTSSIRRSGRSGHIGWFQEYWIARNVQRQRGEHADPRPPRLASILPGADALVRPRARRRPPGARWPPPACPTLQATRQYLVESLETTLELLDATPRRRTTPLYFHRLALFHEEMQRRGLRGAGADPRVVARRPAAARRRRCAPRAAAALSGDALAARQRGRPASSSTTSARRTVAMPEFEIDAQPVTWAQYGEFVEDGGYDEPAHWSEAGWAWVQREAGARRAMSTRCARRAAAALRPADRVPLGQPAMHVSWYEADAWCRWAGRRLPSEVEWEAAAHQGATRGFRWGDVWEWTASTFRPYPGFVAGPWRDYRAALRPHAGAARRVASRRRAALAQRALPPLRRRRARRRILRFSQLRRVSAERAT